MLKDDDTRFSDIAKVLSGLGRVLSGVLPHARDYFKQAYDMALFATRYGSAIAFHMQKISSRESPLNLQTIIKMLGCLERYFFGLSRFFQASLIDPIGAVISPIDAIATDKRVRVQHALRETIKILAQRFNRLIADYERRSGEEHTPTDFNMKNVNRGNIEFVLTQVRLPSLAGIPASGDLSAKTETIPVDEDDLSVQTAQSCAPTQAFFTIPRHAARSVPQHAYLSFPFQ